MRCIWWRNQTFHICAASAFFFKKTRKNAIKWFCYFHWKHGFDMLKTLYQALRMLNFSSVTLRWTSILWWSRTIRFMLQKPRYLTNLLSTSTKSQSSLSLLLVIRLLENVCRRDSTPLEPLANWSLKQTIKKKQSCYQLLLYTFYNKQKFRWATVVDWTN